MGRVKCVMNYVKYLLAAVMLLCLSGAAAGQDKARMAAHQQRLTELLGRVWAISMALSISSSGS